MDLKGLPTHLRTNTKIIYITPAVINRLTISLLEKKLAQKEIAEIIGISTQAARKQI